jgi:hypothetical protein
VPILLGVWLAPAEAGAFCRSRTCKGSGCARDDDGCPAEGLPLYWPGGCVGFSFQRDLSAKYDPELLRLAIRRAFFAWTQLPCPGGAATLTFSENEDTACNASGFDDKGPNVNVVLFRDDDFPYKDEDNTLAKTTVTYDAKTGAILDADIEINSAFNELTFTAKNAVYDLESIMTHEVGHFIGIAHTPVPEATMYAAYETGSLDLRTLDQDDIDAACAIYPPERKVTCDPTPRGGQQVCGDDGAPVASDDGCAVTHRSTNGTSAPLLGLALLALAGRRGARCLRGEERRGTPPKETLRAQRRSRAVAARGDPSRRKARQSRASLQGPTEPACPGQGTSRTRGGSRTSGPRQGRSAWARLASRSGARGIGSRSVGESPVICTGDPSGSA